MPELGKKTGGKKVTALIPIYGSNRIWAHKVGELTKGCTWVGVPFAGGMSEIGHIKATTILVNDLHRDIINLARVVANEDLREQFVSILSDLPFHPEVLAAAQKECQKTRGITWDYECCFDRAVDYFVACWMGRSTKAGTKSEFKGGLPIRWNGNGGDSNKRYRSAIEALDFWGVTFRRCNFSVTDYTQFLETALEKSDNKMSAIYSDAPWPDDGDCYKHSFTTADQKNLARYLHSFKTARVVVRFGDHALIRMLYKEREWVWHNLDGRTQTNSRKREVLLVRKR